MRRYWFILPIALLLVASPLLVMRSQSAVLAILHWSLNTFTDLEAEIKNPEIRLWEGHISADEIHLLPRGRTAPALASVTGLEVDTRLTDLFTSNLKNTLISAAQVLIYVSENDDSPDPKPGSWLQLTSWLPSQLYIGQVHLITAAENTWIFPLRELQGRRLDSTTFRLRSLADYEGEPLEANLDLSDTVRDGQVQAVNLKAGFFAPQSDSKVTLEGVLEGGEETFRYDFKALADYRDIGEFIRGLNSDTVLQGRMQLQARMVGNTRQFKLSEASMVLDNMPAYGFEAAGELHWERAGDSRLRLIAAGEMSDLGYLVNWIDLDVADLGRARASVNLGGSLDEPVVDNFVLVTESSQGLSVNISGKLASLTMDHGASLPAGAENNEIRVDAHAPSVSVLEPWVGELQIDPGPWRASWITRGNRELIQLHDIILETGSEQTLVIRVEGEVTEIANTPELGLAAISGIDLLLKAGTHDSAYLAELTGLELPPYHALDARLQIIGKGDDLALVDGSLSVASSDLEATLVDITGRYRPGRAPDALTDLSAGITARISDTSVLSQYTGVEVPVLGAAELNGALRQSNHALRLEPAELRIAGDDLSLHATGLVADALHLKGVRLDTRVERMDTAQVLAFALDAFQYERELGYLRGAFQLADRDGTWQVANLVLETPADNGELPLDISLRGAINDLTGFTTADLEARLAVHDTALLEVLTGLRVQPVKADIRVATAPNRVDITATGQAGQTRVETGVQVGYGQAGISGLAASIFTPDLHLADLGLQASEENGDQYAPGANIDAEAKSGIESLLDRSPRYPIDIQLKVDGITGRNTNIDSLDVHVTGEDNRYTLRRFSLTYDEGMAEIRGVIDLNPRPPVASLAGEALAIPLSTLSQDLGAPSDIRGKLTARGGLTASGVDIPSLVASLDGSLAIALEDTVIQGAAYDVLATDFLAWIYSGAALETSTHLDCTMARFEISDGIARTDSLYVESARMIATGKGKFDLPRQKMDLTITPRSRTRSFQIPSEVRLKGDMSSPQPTISPISAAADASAQALLLLPKLALRLFGSGGGQSQKGIQPCLATLD